MSQINTNAIYDTGGGSNAVLYGVASPPNSMGFRNRIINGDMRIDQRNVGASVTANNGVYFVDRYISLATQAAKATLQQVSVAPAGFTNSIVYTSSSAYSVLSSDYFGFAQYVEGLNVSDLSWGTASAAPVTLSFWVRSSLTGTFGGSFRNNAGDRSYPFTYAINAANTWEQKTVTIAGDTSGTWLATNGIGIRLNFSTGAGTTWSGAAGAWVSANYLSVTGAASVVGTNGATLYITGVQLEAGTVATPFERRDYGRELIMCQRYYWANTSCTIDGLIRVQADTSRFAQVFFPVSMRAAPTVTQVWDGGSSPAVYAVTPYSYRASVVQGDTTVARVITSVTASSEL